MVTGIVWKGQGRGPHWTSRRTASSDPFEPSEEILFCPVMVLLVGHLHGHVDSVLEQAEHNPPPFNATPFIRMKHRANGSFSGILYIYREFVVGLKHLLRTNLSSWRAMAPHVTSSTVSNSHADLSLHFLTRYSPTRGAKGCHFSFEQYACRHQLTSFDSYLRPCWVVAHLYHGIIGSSSCVYDSLTAFLFFIVSISGTGVIGLHRVMTGE